MIFLVLRVVFIAQHCPTGYILFALMSPGASLNNLMRISIRYMSSVTLSVPLDQNLAVLAILILPVARPQSGVAYLFIPNTIIHYYSLIQAPRTDSM